MALPARSGICGVLAVLTTSTTGTGPTGPAGVPHRFEAEWTAATAQARDEYSVMPVQHFVEKWWLWVAVHRWPELAVQLRECERRAAVADDLADARAVSAEIGQILRVAADAAA